MALTPIIANITSPTGLTVQAYNDGNIAFAKFTTTTQPAICDACRHILKTVGLIAGVYAARPYPMHILAGTKLVFIVQTLYYGSRSTAVPEFSDVEMDRGITFTGQFV